MKGMTPATGGITARNGHDQNIAPCRGRRQSLRDVANLSDALAKPQSDAVASAAERSPGRSWIVCRRAARCNNCLVVPSLLVRARPRRARLFNSIRAFRKEAIPHAHPPARLHAPCSARRPLRSGRFDRRLRPRAARKHNVPAIALAVVRDGKPVKVQAYGLANVEHDVPATADTVFQLASVTKQFTAAAVMRLVEEGKRRWTTRYRSTWTTCPSVAAGHGAATAQPHVPDQGLHVGRGLPRAATTTRPRRMCSRWSPTRRWSSSLESGTTTATRATTCSASSSNVPARQVR